MTSKLSLPDYTDMLGGDKASYETINSKFSTAFDNADKIRDNACYYGETTGHATSSYYYGAWYGAGRINGRHIYFDLPLGHVASSGSCYIQGSIYARYNDSGSSSNNGYLKFGIALDSLGSGQYRFSETQFTVGESRQVIHMDFDLSSSEPSRKCAVGIQLEGITITFGGNTAPASQSITLLQSGGGVSPSQINTNTQNLVAKCEELYHKTTDGTATDGSEVDNINGLIYKAGDVIEYGAIHTAGYITTGSTQVCFSIPLSHPVAASGVSFRLSYKNNTGSNNDYGWWITQNGSDLKGGDGAYDSDGSVSVSLDGNRDQVRIVITYSNALSGAVNNAACGVACGNCILTFR